MRKYEFTDEYFIIPIDDVSDIEIITTYPNSWGKFIKNTLINAGLEEGESNDFKIIIVDNTVSIGFEDSSKTVNVDLTIININAQISPGRIENVRWGRIK